MTVQVHARQWHPGQAGYTVRILHEHCVKKGFLFLADCVRMI